VDVVFDVRRGNPATIKTVSLEGVPDSSMQSLRGTLGVKPGEHYDSAHLRRQLDRLKDYLVSAAIWPPWLRPPRFSTPPRTRLP